MSMYDYNCRFGKYEVKVGNNYTFILNLLSFSHDVHEGKFCVKDKYGILVEFSKVFEKVFAYKINAQVLFK